MVQRLSRSTPPSRSTACSLLSILYPASSEEVKSAVKTLFLELCGDDELMVRRSACIAMGKSFAALFGTRSDNELLIAYARLCEDACDGVRLQAVMTGASLLRIIGENKKGGVLIAFEKLTTDKSWRVRYMVADQLAEVARVIPPMNSVCTGASIFRGLCQDAEAEIRASAVFNMAGVLAACPDANGKKDVLVTGTRLVADGSSHVRMSLASAVLKSVAHVPKDLWGTTIVPTCTALLSDAEADVRLALVSGFSSMGHTAEAQELAPQLTPVVVALADDPKWRVREVVIQQVPYIITALGRNAEEVLEVCITRITDRVATIREAAVLSCCTLVTENGPEWAVKSLFPRVEALAKRPNYLHRIALCNFYTALAGVAAVGPATAAKSILPTLSKLCEDPVANVRLSATRALLALLRANKVARAEGDRLINALLVDEDEDVRDGAAGKAAAPIKQG